MIPPAKARFLLLQLHAELAWILAALCAPRNGVGSLRQCLFCLRSSPATRQYSLSSTLSLTTRRSSSSATITGFSAFPSLLYAVFWPELPYHPMQVILIKANRLNGDAGHPSQVGARTRIQDPTTVFACPPTPRGTVSDIRCAPPWCLPCLHRTVAGLIYPRANPWCSVFDRTEGDFDHRRRLEVLIGFVAEAGEVVPNLLVEGFDNRSQCLGLQEQSGWNDSAVHDLEN